jgi:hypothetical protein
MVYFNLLCSIISLWKYRDRSKFSSLHENNKSTIANLVALAVFIISNDDFVEIMKFLLFFTRIGHKLWPILLTYYESLCFEKISIFSTCFFFKDEIEEAKFQGKKSCVSCAKPLNNPSDRHIVLTPKMKEYIWQFMLLHSEEGKSFRKFKGFPFFQFF